MDVRLSILALGVLVAACDRAPPDPVTNRPAATATEPAARAADPRAAAPAADSWSGFGNGSRSVVRRGDRQEAALFLCNATNQPVSVALTMPSGDGAATLVRLDEQGGRIDAQPVTVGAGDPGAGQVYYPLAAGGQELGVVHAVNGGILDGATTPTVTSVRVDGTDLRCRWQPDTRLLALTGRRAVLVTGPVYGPLVYRSFDYARRADQDAVDDGRTSRATLTVTGGARRGDTLVFTNGATEYRLSATGDPASGAGALEVFRSGRRLQSEPLIAYTLGATAASPPPRVTAAFACEDGTRLSVLFDNVADRAELSFADGTTATLAGQRPASGMWYRGQGVELRGKGDDVTITTADGPRSCRAQR